MGETTTSTPQYQTPGPSPEELALTQRTARESQLAAQSDARMDTARLMAIYGTRLAMGGASSGSPLAYAPAAPASVNELLPSPWTFGQFSTSGDGRL